LGSELFRSTVTIALCILIAACGPTMVNRSDSHSGDAGTKAKDGLLKPRFDENATKDQDKQAAKDAPKTADNPSTEKIVRQVGQTVTHKSEDSERREAKDTPAAQKSAVKSPETESREPQKESPKLSSKDPTLPEGPIRKFDRAKYFEQLRSEASEIVKKEPDSSHAILCRDTITDDWSLSIYRIRGNHFEYVVYAWDEIDEKWTKDYDSEKRPLNQMKDHLKISVVNKECKALKGSIH